MAVSGDSLDELLAGTQAIGGVSVYVVSVVEWCTFVCVCVWLFVCHQHCEGRQSAL